MRKYVAGGDVFHRASLVGRNGHRKRIAMVVGENAEGKPDLFQAAVATDVSRLRFGFRQGGDSESDQHERHGDDCEQFFQRECGNTAGLVEKFHLLQGMANRFVAAPESRRACRKPAESSQLTLPSPKTRYP